MTSPSILISTTTSLTAFLTSSLTTIYQTSQPVLLTTVTSVVSEYSNFLSTATISQSQIIWASTTAIPITVTQTMSQPFTFTPAYSVPQPPPATYEIVTATLTSTVFQPGSTFTYYPSIPPVILPFTTTRTEWYPATSTVTFTQVDFVLESVPGYPYTTFATVLPLSPTPTDAIVLITDPVDRGFDSWSSSAKSGLIAGVIIAGLLILGLITLIIWWLMKRRRRKMWVHSGWFGPPQQQVVLAQPRSRAYWGPGRAGWGIHGGG